MVEYTKVMSRKDIEARGYKDTGYAESGSKDIISLIMEATVENKFDLILRILDEEGHIFQIFKK